MERPASVVKELVENSLDAQASVIEIEIDKGGQKRILVRDNGVGIGKDELGLALSRHATSKISCLDDLEQIMSLGFRGEALASISSVSRLSLSSKPVQQKEAWQAQSEGRDMQVQLHPVAHPNGSSVEVLDLFFNTPARRKFLRSEKTEFGHIDEVVRRIALSRFEVNFSVKHNGKVLRKYPIASDDSSRLKRIGSICGTDFSQNALHISSNYQQLKLQGWLLDPSVESNQGDIQYFYVNGRMMRDKLINHAIRQAFEGLIDPSLSPSFVLYLEIEPQHVDVNVHPAKHEVRFHQARLVHDFIYRAITDVLERLTGQNHTHSVVNEVELGEVAPKHDYILPLQKQTDAVSERASASGYSRAYKAPGYANKSSQPVNQNSALQYQQLMSPAEKSESSESWAAQSVARCMMIDQQQILVKIADNFYALKINRLRAEYLRIGFAAQVPVSQPLLMPISIDASDEILQQAKKLSQPLLDNSIEIGWSAKRVLLRKVPAGLRNLPWSIILPDLLATHSTDPDKLQQHLFDCIGRQQAEFDQQQAQSLWEWCSVTYPQSLESKIKQWATAIPLAKWIEQYA